MRHRNKKIKLGRKTAHRKSTLGNMACSLIEHKRINTTVTKAKALKRFIEPLVTKTKKDSTHNRRIVFRYLRDKESVSELFRTISNKVGDRPGGYTRIIKLGKRMGDNADMAMIEFVDFNDLYAKSDTPKKTTRRGRSKPKANKTKTFEDDVKSSKDNLKEKTVNLSSKSEDKKGSESEDKKSSRSEDKKSSESEDKKSSKSEDKKGSESEDKKSSKSQDNKAAEK